MLFPNSSSRSGPEPFRNRFLHINVDLIGTKSFPQTLASKGPPKMANTGATTEIPNVAVWLNAKINQYMYRWHWHIISYPCPARQWSDLDR